MASFVSVSLIISFNATITIHDQYTDIYCQMYISILLHDSGKLLLLMRASVESKRESSRAGIEKDKFTPTLNVESKRLANANKNKQEQQSFLSGQGQGQEDGIKKSGLELMLERARQSNDRKIAMREAALHEEMVHCTFTPKISEKAEKSYTHKSLTPATARLNSSLRVGEGEGEGESRGGFIGELNSSYGSYLDNTGEAKTTGRDADAALEVKPHGHGSNVSVSGSTTAGGNGEGQGQGHYQGQAAFDRLYVLWWECTHRWIWAISHSDQEGDMCFSLTNGCVFLRVCSHHH